MKNNYSQISTGKKLLVAVFFVFTFIFTNDILAQTTTIQLGSGTSSSGTNVACPINIYYQSLRSQMVYTKAEINAAGFNAQGQIQQIGFYVTGAPSQALPNFTIKMKHTTANDAIAHDAGTLTTVYTTSSYMPTAGGYDMITFTTPFVWNGNDNVLVDICFDPVSTWLSATGQVRIYSPIVNNGFRFKRDNFTSQCGQTTTSPSNFKPQAQMVLQDICTPLSGVYTIGTTGDFLNFTYAVNTLNNCGISAPVTFNVQSGTYTEQVTIPSITGSSSVNTITFQSLSGDSTDVILTYAPTTSTTNWTVRLNGADYITFKNLTLASTGASYGRVVEFINHANNNEFSNNQILMPPSTSSSFAGFYSSSTTTNNNNKILNNRIVNGYYGIYCRGQNTTNLESGLEIKNNILLNQRQYCVMLYYCESPWIEGNILTTNSSSTNYRGIYAYYCLNNARILKNVISKSTNGGYGMYIYRLNYYTHTQTGLIANNFIHLHSTGNTTYGTYIYDNKDVNIYHNSINLTGNYTNSRCIYMTGSNTSGLAINNNIFVNKANGYTIYSNITTSSYTSNYNDFYTTGTRIGYQGSSRTTLAAWQTASAGDANSISVDPGFYTDDDLHIGSIPLNSAGTPLASVTDDIDGESRNTTAPDIGADEFTPSPIDVGASSLENPLATVCIGSSETVTVRVMNYGTVAINLATNPLTVNCNVAGTNPTTFSPVTVNTGNIALGGYIDVSVSSTYNMITTGTYTFNAISSMTGDGNSTNNTMTSTDIINYGTYSLPINETMETFTPGNGSINNPGVLANGWMRTFTTNFQWLVKNGGTPSNYTGPVVDHTLGTSSGIYCYTESSSSSTNNVTELISPCIDLSTMLHPKLSFWYHMYGATTGSMHIDILSGGSWVNDIYVITGQQQTYPTEAWRDATIDISSYIGGIIKVRFRAIRGGNYTGDMAIDDIIITEYPVVNLGNDTVICQGGSVVLNAGSGPGYTYQWTEISSTTIIGTAQTYTATTSGDYIVVVTNSYGATDADTVNVMVGLSPTADAGSNANVCEGNSYTISGATASFYSSIFWATSGSGTFSNNGTLTPTYSPSAADISAGNVTLILIAYAYPPCSNATDNIILTILPAPTVSFSGLAAGYCISDPSVSLTGTPGGGTFTGPGISGNNFNPATAGVGTHTITYSYTDANGCSNSDIQSVIVNGIPNVTFTGLLSSYCINDPSSTLIGSPLGGTFSGTGISGNLFNPATAGTGTHSITYIYVDAFGCTNTDVQSTTVHSLPTVSFSGLGSSYCANDPAITLTGNPNGGNFSGAGISGNSFSPSSACAGNHSITYSYTDMNGCSNSDVQNTTVHPLPSVSFSGLTAGYCVTDPSVTLTGTPSSGTFSGSGMSGNIFSPSNAGVGNHSITFTYTDGNGCSNSDIQNVVVNPIPTVSFSGLATSYCENAPAVTLTGSPLGGSLSGTGISGNTFNPATAGAGIHTITYTYSDIYGCTNSDVQSTTVYSLPTVSFSGLGSSYCENAPSVTLTGNHNGGNFSGTGISGNSFDPASAGAGTHTITYSYTDMNGCSNSDIQNTTVNSLPSVSFSGLAAGYCVTDSSATLTGTPSSGTFNGPGMMGNSFFPSIAGAGTHSITYSYTDGNGCSNSDIQSVIVNPIPTVSFSGLGSSYCEDASAVSLTGSPSGGFYSGAGISGNTFNPATAGAGTHTITYTYSDIYGCTNSDVQSTTVHSLPTVSFSGLGSSYCEDASPVTLSVNPSSGTLSGPGISGYSFNPASAGAGTHTITYSYTDMNACSNSDIQNTTVHSLPSVSFSGLATGYCATDPSVTLTGTPSSGTFSGPGMSGNIFSPSSAGVGNHTITFTYTDGNGCTNSDIQSVVVNPIPTVSFSGLGSSYCEDASPVTLTGNPNGGTFSGTGISGNTFNPATTGAGTHIITYTYSDIYGCSNSDIQSTTVHSLPTVSFSGLGSSYCEDASAVTLTGNPNGGTFSGSGISGNTFNPATAGVGTHTITYFYTDGNGCSNSDIQSVIVNPIPTVSFSGLVSSYCEDASPVTLTGNPNGGTFSGTGISGNTFNPATAGAGTHTITYTYSDIYGCSNSDIQSTTVHSLPTVSFSGLGSSYCENAPSVTLTGNPNGGNFSGTGISGNSFNPTSAGAGTHTITYSYTDMNGCSNSDIQNTTVHSLPSVSFSGLATGYCATDPSVTLTGTPSSGTFSGPGMSGNIFSPSSAGVGNHTITFIYTDGNGCTNSDIQSVVVNPIPTVSFSGLGTSYCEDASAVTLTGNPNGGTFSGTGISGNTFNPATAGAGTHTITYTYSDIYGCSNSDIQSTTVHSLPTVSFSGLGTSYCEDASAVTLTGNPNGGTFSGSGISGNSFKPSTAGVGSHNITYSYTDGNGCSNSDVHSVDVLSLPTVSFSGLASTYCLNASPVFLTGNPFGGTFSGNGITGYIFNPASAGPGTHTISYTYTDWFSGCSNTASQNVTVYSLPAVSITGFASPPEYCANSSSITVTGNPAGGILAGNGISGNTFDPAVAGVGIHLITYSYSDANSCTNIDSVEVTVHSLPGVSFAPIPDVCVDASSFALSGGLPWGGTYSGPGVSSGNFDPSIAGAGVHTITYSYSDINGCTNSTNQTATVHPLPTVSITGLLSSYCIDASGVTLTGNPNGGTFSGTGVTGNIFDPATAGLGTHTITYTYTDGNSCTNSDVQSVIVNPLPTVSFSGLASNYCLDTIDVVLTGNPAGGTFSGNGIIGNIFNPTSAGIGTHLITYTYTDLNACTNSDVQSVTVNPGPIVSFSGLASAYCANDISVTLTGNPSGGTFSGPGISANSFDPVIAGVGTHTITYMYTDATGCSGLTNQSVIVNSLPILSISGLNPGYCINSPMVSLIGSPSGGTFSGNGIIGNTFDPVIAGVGTHIITYTFSDANSCTNSIDQNVTINNLPTVSFTGLAVSYCENAMPNVLIGNPSGGTFSGSGISANIFTPFIAGVGTHNITYTYSDAFGCSNATTQTTTVNALPTVSFSGLASNYCSDTTGFTLFGSPGGGTFTGSGIIGNTFNPNIAGAGFHTITYTFTDINGCSNSTTQQTLVNAAPIANAGNDTTVYYNATFQLNGSASGGSSNYTYLWTGTMSVSNPNIANPTVSNLHVTSVFLLFVYDNTSGCYDTSSVKVTVKGGQLTVGITTFTPGICAGSSADLISLASGGTGNYVYLWSSNPPGFTSTLANPTVTPAVTTMYTVTVTDGSPTGNTTGSMQIIVDPIPVVSISGLQSSYCLNSSPVTMTGSPSGGAFTGSGVTGNVFDPSIAGLGTHDVIYTYTNFSTLNPFGCTNSDTQTVVVNTLPNVTFSGLATSYCADITNVILIGSPVGGTFSGPGISGNIFNPSLAGAGTHSITYDYSAGSGCSNSETQSVIVYALPTVSISGLLPNYCANSPVITMIGIPNGGTFSGSGVIGNTFDPSLAGTGTHTITYVYTDGNSCSTAAGQTVTINPLPPVSFSGLASSYCISSNSSTLTGTPFGGTFSGPGISGNIFDPSIAGVGNHSISYLYTDAFGCSNSDIQTANVDTLPTVTIIGLASVYCVNSGLVTLIGSPTGGTFSGPGVSGNIFNPSIAGTGNHSITYNYNDGNGCSNSTVQVVTVNPLPNVSIIGLASNYCLNNPPTSISGSPSGGTFSGSGIIGNTFNPSIAGTGMHLITYTYTDGIGCSNDATQSVYVDTLPNISFTGLSSIYCEDSMSVFLTGIPGGGAFSGNGMIGNIFNPQFAGSGTHSITYSYTGANGCTNTYSQNTTVNSNPVANAGIDIIILGGQTATLYGSATGSNLTYSWSHASLLNNANIASPTTVILSTSTIFTLTVTDSISGCQGTDEVQVTIGGGPLSVVATANPMVICSGTSSQLMALGTGGTTMYSYNWSSSPSGLSSTLENPVASPLVTTTYTVTISDMVNTSTANVVVTVNPSPTVSLSGLSTSYCLNSPPVTLTGTPAGGTYLGPGVNLNIFDPIIAGVGLHNISYSYTNLNGCTGYDSKSVIINPLPLVSFSGLQAVYCSTSTPDTLSGNPIGGTFSGPGIIGNIFDPIIAGSGTHNITYSYTDANGCINSDLQSAIVMLASSVNFTGLNPVYCENDPPSTLIGFPTGGTFSGPGILGNIFDPIFAGYGTHNISYNYTDANGCSGSQTQSILVNQLPIVSISGLNTIYCLNAPIDTIIGTPPGGILSGPGISGNTFDASLAGLGNHNISYSYTDANGCSNSANQSITVNNIPIANAGPDTSFLCGLSGQIGVAGSVGFTYSWKPTSGLSNPLISNPIASPNLTTVYTLEVTDITSGCSSTDDMIVSVTGGPTAKVTPKDTMICGGNVVVITASGGTTYSWSTSDITSSITVNPFKTTAYVVTVTTGGCAASDTAIVTVSHPNVDLGPDASFCANSSITLDPGSGFSSYLWSEGSMSQSLTVNTSGTYWVSVTDIMGCSNSDTINVNVKPIPYVNLGNDTTINVKYSITLDAGMGFDDYLWSDSSTYQTLTINGPSHGTGLFSYWVEVTDKNICSNRDTIVITIRDNTGISDNEQKTSIKVYPNPTKGIIYLQVENLIKNDIFVEILNPDGQTLYRKQLENTLNSVKEINMTNFSKGVYFVKVITQEQIFIKKVILN